MVCLGLCFFVVVYEVDDRKYCRYEKMVYFIIYSCYNGILFYNFSMWLLINYF